jgi:hypothetical protein
LHESDILLNCTGFEWDKHNSEKIWFKHKVSPTESEQIFFNLPLIVADAVKHSGKENRFYALGHTDTNRLLFVVFTVRGKNIRIISARNMSRKERKVYQLYE